MSVTPETNGSVSSSEASAPLLEMRGISKRFGGVTALSEVSLSVFPGEILALIGENGAGKSTLMKTLGGVHQPDSGEILVGGDPVRIRGARDANQLGIGFIHQELNLLDNLDVASNVYLGREPTQGGPLRLVDQNAMYRDTEQYLQRLGLTFSPRTSVARLSLAQRQLVEIARALSLNARILIMDEPTSSLTLTETQRLLEVVLDLRARQNVSIIYISHRLNEILQIADRVVGLRDGQNAGALAKSEIQIDAMVRLMVGRNIEKMAQAAKHEGETVPPRTRLEVRDLRTVRFPNRANSFELRAGEIMGFAGLVGAGRTEIAQALFGVEPAMGGTLTLDGELLSVGSPRSAIARGIYLIPEDRRKSGLILDMPIRENITLPSLNKFANAMGWISRVAERTEAKDLEGRVGIRSAAASLEANAQTLSGGNQQKVVLAKWLTREPSVLIFDEPTRGVDVGAKAEIYARIRALADEGVAVMVISSDMEEVLTLSDRVAVMHEGGITGILPREAASEEAIMELAVGHAGKTEPKEMAARS